MWKKMFDAFVKNPKWVFIISIVLIIFACAAPIIFTQCDSLVDFTLTGEIGDTIGGIMGPIVAIAGVIMTFVAFLIQVEANKIQRNQLGKSFEMRLLEDKIESRNALQLMSIDINSMIENIDAIRDRIDKFCSATKADPIKGGGVFYHIPTKSLSRYTSIDRNLVYNAFVNFMETNNVDDFNRLYKHMDFYYESLDGFYPNNFKPFADDIAKKRDEIRDAFIEFCKINPLSYKTPNEQSIYNFFYDNIQKCVENNILNITNLYKILQDERSSLLKQSDKERCDKLLDLIKNLVTQNEIFSGVLCDVKDGLKAPYEDLKELQTKIDNALSEHTIESIQEEFYKTVNTSENK